MLTYCMSTEEDTKAGSGVLGVYLLKMRHLHQPSEASLLRDEWASHPFFNEIARNLFKDSHKSKML